MRIEDVEAEDLEKSVSNSGSSSLKLSAQGLIEEGEGFRAAEQDCLLCSCKAKAFYSMSLTYAGHLAQQVDAQTLVPTVQFEPCFCHILDMDMSLTLLSIK